ncbi:minor tail protein [Mycobacterium phage Sheen]|uniref:Minor tail protein n=1 Tax=Mycobacterium phage Sheen TaxID=1589274 RepID=A0A0B4ZYD6_9CAUD|nr:minor tail protein [Mycobacterium phage Sheen]AJD82447.1 minor tail protein [Mycobacterium phage Sheen]
MSLTTVEAHQDLWQKVMDRREYMERERLKPPLIRFWDGDYTLRGEVAGWREIDFEFIENDTGTATIKLSLDHYLAKWVMNFRGREKRNVHITIDKQGARWSGLMDHYKVVREKGGDCYLEVVFKHDFEQSKHILCWANPFLRPELQFPKLWIIFGPAKWCLLMTLFVNILRLETSLWTLPDNPLDINEWMPFSFNPATWRNIVKPFPFIGDNSNLTIVFSRFKSFYDVAKKTLADAQLTLTCRRYLQGDPHPFGDLTGELDIDFVEDLFSFIPLRHGCLVWDIIDNSGWGTETAFGGSLLTGLIRAVVNIASDGTTEGVDVFTGDPTFPGDYYAPGVDGLANLAGTAPQAPWVVFEEGAFTGIESSEFTYYEATATSFVTGGKSMPGVNETISAGVNMAGDFVTSLINSALAAGGAFGTAIDIPPLGGVMDAVAKILYEDVFLAFMEIPTLRAAGLPLPLPGLEDHVTGLGDFHLYEDWCDGADKAFTLSALLAVRARIWATRAHTSHKIKVADAAPYIFGEKGYGHFFIGNRVGTTALGYPIPYTVFVERLVKARYVWDKDGPKGWELEIGYREPEDPALKAMEWIREINSGLGTLGIL